MGLVDKVNRAIVGCQRCPRLIAHCQHIAQVKKRAYLSETYWGKPIPGFGDPKARLWIVGLAPAAHGANRTGRVFTGDSSGNWLYKVLYETGFANQPGSTSINDGLRLKDAYISCTARCAPPGNKPTREEISNCSSFLEQDFEALRHVEAVLALGSIAFEAVQKLLAVKPKLKFTHNAKFHVENLSLFTSYHPSQQNTNTGKLTWKMWEEVFWRIREELENKPLSKSNFVASHRRQTLNEPKTPRSS